MEKKPAKKLQEQTNKRRVQDGGREGRQTYDFTYM